MKDFFYWGNLITSSFAALGIIIADLLAKSKRRPIYYFFIFLFFLVLLGLLRSPVNACETLDSESESIVEFPLIAQLDIEREKYFIELKNRLENCFRSLTQDQKIEYIKKYNYHISEGKQCYEYAMKKGNYIPNIFGYN